MIALERLNFKNFILIVTYVYVYYFLLSNENVKQILKCYVLRGEKIE